MKLIIIKYAFIAAGLFFACQYREKQAAKLEQQREEEIARLESQRQKDSLATAIFDSMVIHPKAFEYVNPNEIPPGKPYSTVPPDAVYAGSESDTAIYKIGDKILSEGKLKGEIADIIKGDYMHLVLRDSANIYHRFFIFLKDQKAMDKLWEGEYPDPDSKVEVHWKRERISIEDTDLKILVYDVDRMKFLK